MSDKKDNNTAVVVAQTVDNILKWTLGSTAEGNQRSIMDAFIEIKRLNDGDDSGYRTGNRVNVYDNHRKSNKKKKKKKKKKNKDTWRIY